MLTQVATDIETTTLVWKDPKQELVFFVNGKKVCVKGLINDLNKDSSALLVSESAKFRLCY